MYEKCSVALGKPIVPSKFISVFAIPEKQRGMKIEMIFSKEALVGFATNLLWAFSDDDYKHTDTHSHIDALGGISGGNQAFGFFLTSESPSMVIQFNRVQEVHKETHQYKDIEIWNRFNRRYKVNTEYIDDSYLESYEIGFTNIADIKIYDVNNVKISDKSMMVLLNINYDTFKDFATMLLMLANNYKEGLKYPLLQSQNTDVNYNLGVILTEDSHKLTIGCGAHGNIFDHNPQFGAML